MPSDIDRRTVLASACLACAAAVAGCAGYGAGRSAPAAAPAPAGTALAATADIPVGGGVVFADRDVVVTQPADGEFRAFTATCTHEACVVANVDGGTINCTCHGSSFAVADGSVLGGPAPSPLAERAITVADGTITLA